MHETESYASINDAFIFLINTCMFEVQDICKDMTKSDKKGIPLKFLSPLLYILYANDLPCVITHGLPVMFADDTALAVSGTTPEQLYIKIIEQIHKVYNWCNHNRLSLNISKTK